MRKLVAIVVSLLAVAAVQAANHGTIHVRVATPDGLGVEGVRLSLRSAMLLAPVAATADHGGQAHFPILPPGSYVLTVEGIGFATVEEAVTVTQNSEVEVAVELRATSFSGDITVSDQRVSISSLPTGVAEHLSLDELGAVPVGRDYRAYPQLVSGVNVVPNSGGLETRHEPTSKAGNYYHDRGASLGSRDNVYYLDGFNITDMASGTGAFTFHNEAIAEQDVITSGVPPEFGGGAGFVANIVTRSGGSTMSGSFNTYFLRPSLYSSLKTDDPRLQTVEEDQYDVGATLGGPLLAEKLWFFVAAQQRSSSDDIELSPSASPTPAITEYSLLRRNAFAKLTWQPAVRSSVTGGFYTDPRETSGSLDVNLPQNRYRRNEEEHWIGKLGWQQVLAETVVLDARLGRQYDEMTARPQHPEAGPSNTILYLPGETAPAYERYLGSAGNGGQTIHRKLQANVALTAYLEGLGSHQLKGGVEYWRWEEQNGSTATFERSLSSLAPSLSGLSFAEAVDLNLLPESEYDFILRTLQEAAGTPAFSAADLNGDGTVSSDELSSLAFESRAGNLDGVNFLASELVQAGVNNVQEKNLTGFVQDTWRIGEWALSAGVRVEKLEYLASDGSTILSLDPAYLPRLGVARQLGRSGGRRIALSYGVYSDLLLTPMVRFAGNLSGSVLGDQVFIGDDWFTYRTRGSAILNRDAGFAPNLKNETERELQLTYEARLAGNLRWLAQAYYRRDRHLIEDYDPNVYFDPAVAGDLVLSPATFGYGSSGPMGVNYFLGNLVGGEREARGLDLLLERPYADGWRAAVQYSFKDAEGNSNSNGAADLQGDFLDLDPRQPHMWGDLPGTIQHQAKLMGSYSFPFGLEVGGLLYWADGAVFTEADIFRPGSYDIYYNHRREDGSYVVTGRERHPSYTTLDLRLRHGWRLVGSLEASVTVDILNALDNQDAIRVEEAHNDPEFTVYGEPRLLLAPRRAQIGLGLSW